VGPKPLIAEGTPPWPESPLHRQHDQLAHAENLTTLSTLTASFSRILQISGIGFISRAHLFAILKLLQGDFKILKSIGEPYFRPKPTILSHNLTHFLLVCPFNGKHELGKKDGLLFITVKQTKKD
jgi:hypothetical protein